MVFKGNNKFCRLRLQLLEMILTFGASFEELILPEGIVEEFQILMFEFSSASIIHLS